MTFKRFERKVRQRYPTAKVLYANGDGEPDINNRNGLGLELSDGRRIAYQFDDTPSNRHAAEIKLWNWLGQNYEDE